MARPFLGVPGAVLGLTLSLLLGGCYGAYQVKPDHPTGAGTLMPTVEDKDAGFVGIASGFDLKAYPVIAISLVTADRRVAQMGFFGGDSGTTSRSRSTTWRGTAKFLVRLSRGEAPRKE